MQQFRFKDIFNIQFTEPYNIKSMGKDIATLNRKSVVHVVLSLEMGGLEKVVFSMVLEQQKLGYDIHVICLDEIGIIGEELSAKNVNIFCLNRKKGPLDIIAVKNIIQYIKTHKINIIHTHNIEAYLYGTIAAYSAVNTKTIHTQHGIPDQLSFFKTLFMRTISWKLGKLITVSNDAAEHIKRIKWVNSKKIQVIINGVNTANFTKNLAHKKTLRKQFNIPQDALILTSISRIEVVKDHTTMIEQFSFAAKKIPNIYLFIVGDGSLKEKAESLVIKYNLNGKIIFTGLKKNILDYLQVSDVFFMTSISEGISISLLEAMSSELIPIVTPVGGNTEVVDENINGYYLKKENQDSLLKHLTNILDSKEKNHIAKKSREKIINFFSQETMINQYQKYYEKL